MYSERLGRPSFSVFMLKAQCVCFSGRSESAHYTLTCVMVIS
jgi:hypothetical protein